jgi:hypothetical protein
LVLKARDTWPRTARIYCHRAEGEWPETPDIVEDVPVLECRRRGVAVDLVLGRPRENRSQLVFTRLPSGREGIFWQTRKVASTARPGARIPGRRISDLGAPLTILVDTRERYPWRFAHQQAIVAREVLSAGDYAVRAPDGRIVAAVERKSLSDLAVSLNNGSLVFELGRLAELPRAAVAVEDRYAALVKHAHAPTGFLPDLLARVQVRYPEIPIVFLETRPLAEEWAYRWLGAAFVELEQSADRLPGQDHRRDALVVTGPLPSDVLSRNCNNRWKAGLPSGLFPDRQLGHRPRARLERWTLPGCR